MSSQLAYLVVTIAVLVFSLLLYFYGDPTSKSAALTFAALAIGHWFGVISPAMNSNKPASSS